MFISRQRMNSGKVYKVLIDKINNNLIKIIQEYNIIRNRNNEIHLKNLRRYTIWIKINLDNYNCSNLRIYHKKYNYWSIK